ncbi:transcription antiterminator [Terrisporobacter mayombei]|nr:transcription antiterminator [Terrisporobacter mayombei]
MNKRQEEFLGMLIKENDYIDTNYVTEKLGCSERSIRNYCNDINNWLSTFSNVRIDRISNLGLKLIDHNNERNMVSQKLRREVKKLNSSLYRHIEILNLLLINKNTKITVSDISKKLYINKNIVREEINALINSLNEYELELNIKKNTGISILGAEKNIRIMLVDYFYKYIDSFRLNMEEVEIFHTVDVIVCRNIMNMIEERLNMRFTDISFKQLTLFFIISIIRIRQGKSLNLNEDYDYGNLIEILDDIEEELKSNLAININKNEKIFFLSLIQSMNKELTNNQTLIIDKDIEKQTKEIIKLVSEESGINFEEDVLLYEHLLYHINTTNKQIKNNVSLKNPLLEDIKGKYYFLFNVISDAIRNNNDVYVSEDIIAYLTLHFQVSLERKKRNREDFKRVSIVCPLSFGVSTLLKVKLEKNFDDIKIIETIREEDLKRNKFNKNIDFMITLRDYENIHLPKFITTPLFTKEDEIKLKDFISNIKVKDTSYRIMNKLMISDYFIQEIDYEDIYECIKYLAERLVKKHYVDKEYVKSIIEREHACPTYIGNGILLPHGDIKYVKQSVLCFARLKNPIKLKNGHHTKIIIILAYKNDNREEFQELFQEVSRLTEDENMVKEIMNCNIKDIKNILV